VRRKEKVYEEGGEKMVLNMTLGISTIPEGGHPMLSGGVKEMFP
jgi:hypothetical protein